MDHEWRAAVDVVGVVIPDGAGAFKACIHCYRRYPDDGPCHGAPSDLVVLKGQQNTESSTVAAEAFREAFRGVVPGAARANATSGDEFGRLGLENLYNAIDQLEKK
jgi:hypothetical protein